MKTFHMRAIRHGRLCFWSPLPIVVLAFVVVSVRFEVDDVNPEAQPQPNRRTKCQDVPEYLNARSVRGKALSCTGKKSRRGNLCWFCYNSETQATKCTSHPRKSKYFTSASCQGNGWLTSKVPEENQRIIILTSNEGVYRGEEENGKGIIINAANEGVDKGEEEKVKDGDGERGRSSPKLTPVSQSKIVSEKSDTCTWTPTVQYGFATLGKLIIGPETVLSQNDTSELGRLHSSSSPGIKKWAASGHVRPAAIVNDLLENFIADPVAYNEAWLCQMVPAFERQGLSAHSAAIGDLVRFFLQGWSGPAHNQMQMRVIIAPPAFVFAPHAHANIEYISVLAGTLYENRLDKLANISPQGNARLPSGSSIIKRRFPVGSFFANEIGSVHLSYTGQREGVAILAVFGGLTAHRTIEEEDSDLNVDESGSGVELQEQVGETHGEDSIYQKLITTEFNRNAGVATLGPHNDKRLDGYEEEH